MQGLRTHRCYKTLEWRVCSKGVLSNEARSKGVQVFGLAFVHFEKPGDGERGFGRSPRSRSPRPTGIAKRLKHSLKQQVFTYKNRVVC